MIDINDKFTYSKIILLERKPAEKISIYPNPADHIVRINIQSLAACNYQLTIRDMAGKRILVENRSFFNGLNIWELNVSRIITGLCQLAIKKEKEDVVLKTLLEIIH